MTLMTTIQKWGNSLAVRIPNHYAKHINVTQGSEIELSLGSDQTIILKPKKRKPTLEELVAKITPENRHNEIDFGRTGKELL
ncbi:suppressor of ppGpp-regulated growth inhibitor (ChpA/MazF) [Halalkalibacterium halodurans C-125]|uniref:Suppressor of ppGpp-regulated growth inhibitor (ChpA/MazF) n=1 Tax=Halalkalibacterium halodurans (strain ATCC BAA-125 / DSM 18197 / FERM 7344 / JCM 9153 / C-125) TaxID=272558 RepID=Q9K6K9_HALH5|nr:suppressor of ppGpp-regulated growth inhibitor (ChpA/MazF) [Halalkalibacterium halodurans C-125]